MTDMDGSFQIVGNTGNGIPVGQYKVVVSKMALPDGTVPKGEQLVLAQQQGLLRNVLPGVYEDRASTPLRATLRGGNNTVNLELKRQP